MKMDLFKDKEDLTITFEIRPTYRVITYFEYTTKSEMDVY